jgi:hypothetical protein
MNIQRHYCLVATTIIGAALGGCAAPIDDGSVDSQAEQLNSAPDFQVGVVAVEYVGNKVNKGPIAWTKPLLQAAGAGETNVSSGWTYMPNGDAPDGIRVAIQRTGDPSFYLLTTDFRITLQASDNIHFGTRPGPEIATPWASQGGGSGGVALDGIDNMHAKAYSIGIELRQWPAAQSKNLADLQLGVAGCVTSFLGTFIIPCGELKTTEWLSSIDDGAISFSHTTDGGEQGDDGVGVQLNVKLE